MRIRRLAVLIASALVASLAWVGVAPAPAGAAAKDPVIIVAGTFSPAFANEPLAARLRANGYQVHIFELPTLGTQDIHLTAQALDGFADGVRAQHGASRVDLIGHSQGGLVARAYVKWYGGAGEVDSLITLGSPHRGTYLANLANLAGFGNCLTIVACQQMLIGSSFLDDLNAGDDTIGNVRYTTIRTSGDLIVRPVNNATLYDGAVNVRIQDRCWLRVVGHIGLITDGTAYSGIKQALEGKTNIKPNCWAW